MHVEDYALKNKRTSWRYTDRRLGFLHDESMRYDHIAQAWWDSPLIEGFWQIKASRN